MPLYDIEFGRNTVGHELDPIVAHRKILAAIHDIADRVKNQARLNAPGHLAVAVRETPLVSIGTDTSTIAIRLEGNKAGFVHGGTGLFGPEHKRITGGQAGAYKNGKIKPRMLIINKADDSQGRVKTESGVSFIFRRSVRGQKANPFVKRAFEEVNASYTPIRLAELTRELTT